MKFGHALRFNCVSQWSEHYICYEHLKRAIMNIQQAKSASLQSASKNNVELPLVQEPALLERVCQAEKSFLEAFEREAIKVSSFYTAMECKLFEEADSLAHSLSPPTEEAMIHSFTSLNNLKEYLETNHTGFSKAIKKHEKYGRQTLRYQLEKVQRKYLPIERVNVIEDRIWNVEKLFAQFLHGDNISDAKAQLRNHLREHVAFERNVLWREMLENERKIYNASLEHQTGNILAEVKFVRFLLAVSAFLVLLLVLPIQGANSALSRCFALVVFVILLWCLEVFPLFVTALLVPFVGSGLRVVKVDGKVVDAMEASGIIFHSMFSHVIMVLLGSFTIAAAISKFGLSKRMVQRLLLALREPSPRCFLLVMMSLTCVLSAFLSNVASPVLCYSVIHPLISIRNRESKLAKALVLSICIGANVGGIASPISSPQNIFAIQELSKDKIRIGWIEWSKVSIPICFFCILLNWLVVCWNFGLFWHSSLLSQEQESIVLPRWNINEPLTSNQKVVVFIFFLSITTWIIHPLLAPFCGQLGNLGIVPLFLYFGLGLLSKEDFNGFPWNIVMLSMCGLALGKCIQSSGLLEFIALSLSTLADWASKGKLLLQFLLASLLTACISSFISHTVAAIIFLPAIHRLFHLLWNGDQDICKLLVLGSGFACSFGIVMPFSSFPNVAAFGQENHAGVAFLENWQFIKVCALLTVMNVCIAVCWSWCVL